MIRLTILSLGELVVCVFGDCSSCLGSFQETGFLDDWNHLTRCETHSSLESFSKS